MPALKNHRQERFCQLIKQGVPPYRAYPQAGYKFDEGAPYRLSGNVRVKARLSELTKGMRMKTRVTVESLTAEFNEAIALAREIKSPGALTGAAIAKGKLHGLIIDRKESGQPGEFGKLSTPDEVVAAIRAELGDAAANLLLASVGRGEASTEQDATGPEPGEAIN